MNYRSSEILADESIATAGTKTIDINLKDVISRITIQVKLTNASSTPLAHPAKAVSKIEVVDGSNVVFSMKGIAAQALDFYDRKVEPFNAMDWQSAQMCIATFNLNFGRRLFDPQLALDPTKFNNLQLKISHNKALGGCTPTAGTMRVRADVFDEKVPSPAGFLCSKEHYAYALVSSGITYVDLPTDYIMRKLLLQTNADAKSPYEQINQVKLSEEHDKRVVLEGSQSDFIKYFGNLWPRYSELIHGITGSTAVVFYITPTHETAYAVTADQTTCTYHDLAFLGGQSLSLKATSTGQFRGNVAGYCPHGAVPYPFGDQDDLSDWYDVTRLGSLQLKLTAGSSIESSSTAEVITQQLRTY